MSFLKTLKSLLTCIVAPLPKTQPQGWQSRRSTHFETLESRELLSVNVLDPVTAYAQPNNPAEIRFDLTTNGNIATKFDFTVQQASGSTFDPSQLRLLNRSNGQSMVLSNSINGTISSSASAMLATGSYSMFVSADAGKGYFTFTISQENQIKSGLEILVMAAIAQQQQPTGWANRVSYYNNLLANTSYAGAASAMPIAKYYPEVDVNGDGKIDMMDSTLAKQNVNSTSGSVNSYTVVKNDPVPETIQDKGNGNIAVPSNHRVQSVAGQTLQTGQSKTLSNGQGSITLKTDGSLTLTPSQSFVQQLAHGETKTVSVPVVTQDVYGNTYTFTAEFTVTGQNELPILTNSTPINYTFNQTSGSGTVKTTEILKRWTDQDHNAKLSVINPVIQNVSSSNSALNSKYTPASLQQYLSLTTAGITFTASDSFFNDLGLNETLTINVSYNVKDEYGQSPNTGTLMITVNGNDNPSVVTARQTVFQIDSNDINNPIKSINAGFSVTDPDLKDATGFVYSVSNIKDNSTTANNGLISGFNSTNGTFNIDTSKLKNRYSDSVVTVNVAVKSASGGMISKTLTINLKPLAIPVASPLILTTTETTPRTGQVTPTISGTTGFKTTGLTIVNEQNFGTLSNGISLTTIASLDENGNFIFTPGKNFEYLKQGESLKLKFQYTITDTQYGLTGLGTIELTINGTATIPTGPTNQIIGTDGRYSATENNGTVSKIVVPKSDILNGWTLPDGADAYSIIIHDNPILFEAWSGGTTNPLGSDSLGSVNFDSSGNLVFWSDSQSYKKLGHGQWLDVTVPVSIRDASGTMYSIGKVLFKVHGANNVPELNCQYDQFRFASNSNDNVSINPVFSTNDPDLNDNTNLFFSIDSNSQNLGFEIASNGIISISNENKNLLNGDYTITVTLSDHYGGTTTKDIAIQVFKESNPVVSEKVISVAEKNSSDTIDLNSAISQKTGHSYSFATTPQLKQILLNGTTYPFNTQDEYYTFDLTTGEFRFNAQNNLLFDFLTTDDILSFQFEYTVSDNNYVNCQSTGSLIVNITGENDLPVQISGQNQTINDVTESKEATPILIADLLNGWNDVDHENNVLKISEVNINGSIGNTPIQFNELQQVTPALFTISDDGRNLIFDSAHQIFRKLGYGEDVTLTVAYTVCDPKGGSGIGNFTITVKGSNDPPELNFGNFVWQFNESDISQTIDLAEYVTDLDENDSHLVIQINEQSATAGSPITLSSGATVTYLGNLQIKYELKGQFEYLSKDELESDSFDIIITDSKTNGTSTATLHINITGENDTPTISGDNNFAVTNSGVAAGNTIDIGTFMINDIDNSDTLNRSINVTKVTKNGQDFAILPQCFNIDDNGNVTMTNTDLPDLAPGESVTFTAIISVTDSHETITKEITVTVYAKKLPEVQLIDNGNEIINIDVSEDENISKSLTISVTDTPEEFAPQRTGNNWYNQPELSVSVDKYSETINELSSLFNISGDAEHGYILNFNAEANTFDFLQKDEKLTFTITINVTDKDYDVTATQELTLTVTGRGDQHDVSGYISSFDFWVNEQNPMSSDDREINDNIVIFKPNYQITDQDKNETYQYNLINNNSAEISIDPTTGNITLNCNDLTTAATYTLEIRVTSTNDEYYQDIVVTLNVKFADAPVVSGTLTSNIDETNSDTITVDIAKPTDNAERNDENWYTIGNLSLKDYTGTIPEEFNIHEIALAVASFEGDVFTFNSETFFDFLPAGASLTLTYEFTVYDTKFDAETTKEISVTINGQNTQPQWKDEISDWTPHHATDDISETAPDESRQLCSIDDLVEDVDLNDSLSLATINGVDITENTWIEIKDEAENSLGEFYYDSATKNIYYRATGNYLAKIRHNELINLPFSFIVKDNAEATTELKEFAITITGTNKPPMVANPDIPPIYNFTPSNKTQIIHVGDIAMDINEEDTLNFYSINGTQLANLEEDTEGDIIVKEDANGIQIRFNRKNNTITVTILDTYDWDTFKEVTFVLDIGVTDDSGSEENCRSIIPITFYLPKQ